MSLANEAGYLYVLSKKLTKINKLIKHFSRKAHKHKTKHYRMDNETKKDKHRKKHAHAAKNIKELLNEHNKILTQIKHHSLAFAHQLQKEHKLK